MATRAHVHTHTHATSPMRPHTHTFKHIHTAGSERHGMPSCDQTHGLLWHREVSQKYHRKPAAAQDVIYTQKNRKTHPSPSHCPSLLISYGVRKRTFTNCYKPRQTGASTQKKRRQPRARSQHYAPNRMRAASRAAFTCAPDRHQMFCRQ